MTSCCVNSRNRTSVGRRNLFQIMAVILSVFLSVKLHSLDLFDAFKLLTELAAGSDTITVTDKGEWDNGNTQAQKGYETARPVDAQSIEHGLCGKRENCSKNASRTARSRLCACRQSLVCVGQIVQHCHEN